MDNNEVILKIFEKASVLGSENLLSEFATEMWESPSDSSEKFMQEIASLLEQCGYKNDNTRWQFKKYQIGEYRYTLDHDIPVIGLDSYGELYIGDPDPNAWHQLNDTAPYLGIRIDPDQKDGFSILATPIEFDCEYHPRNIWEKQKNIANPDIRFFKWDEIVSAVDVLEAWIENPKDFKLGKYMRQDKNIAPQELVKAM